MGSQVVLIARYGSLGTILLFSLVTLGISGSLVGGGNEFTLTAEAFALAVSVITMAIIIPTLIIEFFRKGAFTSMVAVEFGWSAVLTILWVAAAGVATSTGAVCVGDRFEENCSTGEALIWFSWLNFINFFGWTIALLALALTAHSRGNTSIWTSSINTTNFLARKAGGYMVPQRQMQYGVQPQYSDQMQQQYVGPPQQYPPQGYYASAGPPPGAFQV
ncbi:hypothetical protein K439DRAFT_1633459 [Ramaria rubella]|nr:hypothetical protein K439DRAFT_1633459 [Ramaria rubella]